MMESNGWTGRILSVNLTERTFTLIATDAFRDFIGGRGINEYLLLKEMPVDGASLSPENVLIFGVGPLVGTPAFSSSRMNIDFKNVLTGGVGSANVGGHFPAELKFAGYDHIVLKGKSDRPLYLYIQDDRVEFKEARHIWGKGIQETASIIRNELSDPNVRIASIGPAGENGVKFACIIVDEGRAAGYGGCGAVMGSKNLKAIAVRGSKKVKIANPSFFEETLKRNKKKIDASESIRLMRLGGTHLTSGAGGLDHSLPQGFRNLQDEFWPVEKGRKVREGAFKPFELKRLACFNCPIGCSHLYQIQTGENKGRQVEGIQSNTVRAFSSNLDIADLSFLLSANFLCNDLGLDVDGVGAILGWVFECFERGIIDQRDTEGLNLAWGNGDAALALIKKIAMRHGLGDMLAEGVHEASRRVDRGAEEFAMHVKGAPINETLLRTHKGWALGIITSTRGSGHLRGSPNTERKSITPAVSHKLWEIPNAGDPSSYSGKGKLVSWFESFKAVVDSLGICYFTTYWRDINLLGPEDLSDLLYGATNWKVKESELLRIGEKIHNIEKAFNTLHVGFTRKEDFPPTRLMESRVSQGQFEGEYLNKEKWNLMLDEYYDFHQWDRETGWQTETCLDSLGLPPWVKERLKACGRIIV